MGFKMKVLNCINSFDHGGAESFVFSLLKASSLSDDDFAVALIGSADSEINDKRLLELNSLGVKTYVCDAGFFGFFRAIRNFMPDVVHCHNLRALILAVLCKFFCFGLFKFKIVFTQHTSYLKRKFFHFFLKPFVSAYVALNYVAKDDFSKVIKRECVYVVENGIEEFSHEQFSEVDPSNKNIVFIARFDPIKNHRLLMDSLSMLKKKEGMPDNLQIFLIGDGPTKPDMERLAGKYDLNNNVTFLGAISNARKYIANFDFVLLCSSNEGQPIVILEALFSKVPIIAPRVGGIPELINDRVNGFLYESNNVSELSLILRSCLDDKIKVNSDAYFSLSKFDFSIDSSLKKHQFVYKKILGD